MGGRQAIVTRFIGPTNRLPSRVSAVAMAGRVVINWDSYKGIDENHNDAARALADKFGWPGHWSQGVLPFGRGFVYVDENVQVTTGGRIDDKA